MSRKLDRRGFLAALGSTGALATAGTAAASRRSHGDRDGSRRTGVSAVDNEQGLPITARGQSTHTYVPDGDAIVHRHQFESRDLAERYGDPVVKFGPESLPREQVAPDLRDGGRVTADAERVIGTFEEHANSEEMVQKEATSGRRVSAQDHLNDLPLAHYESKSEARSGDKAERKAPINVAWTLDSAQDVQDVYYDELGWGDFPPQPPGARYIIHDGNVKSTDKRIRKSIDGGLDSYEQYDIRAYNIDDHYSVLGQAHIDPPDHNQDCKYLDRGCEPWEFNDARDTALGDWEDGSENWGYRHSLGYEKDYDTFDGKVAIMYP